MLRAEQGVNLQDMGIKEGLKVRRSVTGARVLQLHKSQSMEVADQLAANLRTALAGMADVIRPVKRADIRVTGMDDSATEEKVRAAVARTCSCDTAEVQVGQIQRGPRGMGMVKVRCPVAAAKMLADAGRLLVGWSSAGVQVLESLPLRCFRCLELGHTAPLCPSTVDRSELCFRCGSSGHKLATCVAAIPRCAVCFAAGRPADHTMGGRLCKAPSSKGKVAQGPRATALSGSCRAQEEAEMST